MKPYYEENGITIYHGDCREILNSLDANILITDPPFGIDYKSGQAVFLDASIRGDKDTSCRDFVVEWWGSEKPALIFGSYRAVAPKYERTRLIWDTGGALGMGALDLPWKPSWQQIHVSGKGFIGKRTSGVIYCSPVQAMASNGRVHPNEKPLKLIKELMQKCPDGIVIDPFMGSGTTLRAAKDLGRKAIGIEIEEKYCEIAAKRLRQEVFQF